MAGPGRVGRPAALEVGEDPAGTERNVANLARIIKRAPAGTIFCEDPYLALRGKLRIEAGVLAAYLASCGVLAPESAVEE
jgi:hypothetical protein